MPTARAASAHRCSAPNRAVSHLTVGRLSLRLAPAVSPPPLPPAPPAEMPLEAALLCVPMPCCIQPSSRARNPGTRASTAGGHAWAAAYQRLSGQLGAKPTYVLTRRARTPSQQGRAVPLARGACLSCSLPPHKQQQAHPFPVAAAGWMRTGCPGCPGHLGGRAACSSSQRPMQAAGWPADTEVSNWHR